MIRVEIHGPAVEARDVSRRFGDAWALRDVSLRVRPGEIHALLGPNGAGKTTLLRILAGLLTPTSGSVEIAGRQAAGSPRELRRLVGLVPSGDRTFYLRISALENLAFFGRLHGLRRREALARARETLDAVGLLGAARRRVGEYSHGMQKRLGVARALLTRPPVLLVDEATHDLDPEGALRVRELVTEATNAGAAVLWATQRLDEIRGFAHTATLLNEGEAAFAGTVARLLEHSVPRRYVLRLRNGRPAGSLAPAVQRALGELGRITMLDEQESEHYLLALAEGTVLGDALAAVERADVQLLACRQERSDVEDAFLALVLKERR